MLTVETCTFCKGRKQVDQFQERKHRIDFPETPVWVPEQGTLGLPEHCIDEMRAIALARAPWAFRWAVVDCPRCDGVGEYVVEHFACKIF
jgi:hypothetical protein